jgi:peptidoglycan/LPS O-acetylase OafA/YrhL
VIPQAPNNGHNAARLDSLTFLRFVAAFAIVLHHSVDTFRLPHQIRQMDLYLAVSFFFVLSGFILVYVYPTFTSYRDIWRFWQARIARCWPIHMLCFLAFAYVIKFGLGYDDDGNPALRTAIANVFLLQAWIPRSDYFFAFNAPSWSVSVEFFFYFCFPFIQLWQAEKWVILKSLMTVCCAAALSIACWHAASFTQSDDLKTWLTYICPLSRLFEFVFGMFCAAAYFRVRALNTVGIATIIQLATFLVLFLLSANLSILGSLSNACPPQMLFGTFCGFLIVALALDKGIFSKWLAGKLGVKLGDISYGVYMIHSPLSHAFRPFWEHLARSQGYLSFAIYVISLLVICLIVHMYFERPLRDLLLMKKRATRSS